MRRIVCLTLVLMLASVTLAADRQPFTPRDLWEMQRVSEPHVSPDGSRVVFTLRTTDFDANLGRNDLWVVGVDSAGLRRLTTDVANDTAARWAPDGRSILFLSARSGSSQVWRIAVDGGEAEPITDLPLDVGAFLPTPDGARVLVAMDVFPDCTEPACTAQRLADRESDPETGMVFDGLFVRHWDRWKDGRRSHLFVLPIAGGDPVDLMKGMDADAPSKPFGGMEEVAFTPDGTGVVFTARDAGTAEAWSTDFDLFVAALDGSAPPRALTDDNPAWDTQPSFSPDGKTLAYSAMARPGFEADRFRVILRPWPEGDSRVLTADWDRSVTGVVWAPDGKTLYAAVGDVGNVVLYAIDVRTGTPTALTGPGHVRWPQIAGERVLFGRDTFTTPVDLYSCRPDGSDVRRITGINDERLDAIAMGEAEPFSFEGAGGDTVHGWVVRPAGFVSGTRYPVAFLVHGGPQGSWDNDFHYRWNPQIYAGAGYAVVMVDFHGSTGYGQAFTDAIRGDWGGKPLIDLRLGLAAAVERYPFMDPDRACALGASYGGYMMNWIAGHWPDGFRCLVNHDGVFDTRAMYFETEELWFPEWENLGTPWDSPETYDKFNPSIHVEKWQTPMLVVQGSRDFRVPEVQSLGAFNALRRRGVPGRLLVFPDENHFVLKPANALQWHREVLGWIDRWSATPRP